MRVLIDTGSNYSSIRSYVLGAIVHSPVRSQKANLMFADGSLAPISVVDEVLLSIQIKLIHIRSLPFYEICVLRLSARDSLDS